MGDVDIRQLFDSDPRPTFVVDCDCPSSAIYHVNIALLAIPHIALSLSSHNALRDWWDPVSLSSARHQNEFRHGRYRWAKFVVCSRWLVVTIVQQPPPSIEQSGCLSEPARLSRITSPLWASRPDTIFTIKIQSPELRKHIERIRKVDWSKTSLGPISSWGYELNLLVTTLMLETRPTALFLGPERTILYNLAYGAVTGSRHPAILGQSILDAWPELADPISTTMDRSEKTRFADVPEEEFHFMVERNGFVEEVFFMWSLAPLVGVGDITGMYSIVTEVTKQRLLERRVNALLRVGRLASKARTTKEFWAQVGQAIQPSEYDFPAAILYSNSELNEVPDAADVKTGLPRRCALQWTIGYKPDHCDIPQHLDLDQDTGLARAFSASIIDGPEVLFEERDGILPTSLYTDLEKRGFGDPLKVFLVLPIRTYDNNVVAFLLIGLNTRRPYDDEYKDWINVFSNLLGASAALVALHEEEVRRRKLQEEQAARDREALNAEVATLTQEASNAVEKLRNFHEIADQLGLGYFEIGVDGMMVHANVRVRIAAYQHRLMRQQETYFVQTGHRRDLANCPPFAFKQCIHEDDVATIEDQWETLIAGEPITFEVRWKRHLNQEKRDGKASDDYLWTLSACVPIKDVDGIVTGVFGCNTDISAQKEATEAVIMRSEAERRLASFTELAPVGLYHLNQDLSMRYCNDQWFRITGHDKVPMDQVDWRNIVDEDRIEACYRDVDMTRYKEGSHTFSTNLKKQWTGPDGVTTSTWILATATAYADGTIMGTMTDISQLKWAESIQKTRVEEALESKRQQENFIDMTSHEMRNPLSAMVQCADSIMGSLGEMKALVQGETLAAQPDQQAQLEDLIESSLDAIDTIQACATHQKRIVDDILTLSKLDSKLLVISPMVLQPVTLLQDAYKMFKDEANKLGIDLEMRCDPSVEEMEIDWAILDPSRVLQILINLLTNAIKFTKDQERRKVEVIMGASREVEKMPEIEYVPQEALRRDFLAQTEEDHAGEVFYLNFTVRDSGCGLSPEHKAKLFLRFSQATPKTHVQYGGTGLGLFISRELTELQGGSIGVASDQNIGSTFSFYIKSRRAASPRDKHTAIDVSPTPNGESSTGTNGDIIGDMNGNRGAVVGGALSLPEVEEVMEIDKHHYNILVVEDNLINQRVLSAQLKKLGHTVHVANHGVEALSHLSRTPFSAMPSASPSVPLSVVLMDIEMPVMDGLTCTRRIREMEAQGELSGHVPIIAVSANARREQVELAKSAGVDGAICKPFRVPELIGLIEGLGIK
ncbi:hypothetical protein COCMIDRAFT_93278 [Bipolaris oryzae ATCC 44560]|uniref:Histidine kinase n=1 Tax=Bipolaris oryzae ATCC 44560 TaxID=930090 RepID=W6ZFI4_COCMI|nr:uncharacterized protein COCMIDRAFT_93278 [Bipolaris oryzae ATCC 44560]EUC46264.1 hypothetical protein COCMIDRAFT_93278 [Bipolaris oryzae ATCC 44560]